MILSVFPLLPVSVSAASDVSQDAVNRIVAKAKSMVSSTNHTYDGYCQKFVRLMYESAEIYANPGASTATEAWNMWGKSTSKNNIPIGACVYTTASTSAGHVGIYVGDGKVVHARDGIRSDTLDAFIGGKTYLGWGVQGGGNINNITPPAPQKSFSDAEKALIRKLFSPEKYKSYFIDVWNEYKNLNKLIDHFLAFGAQEPGRIAGFSLVFDPAYYLSPSVNSDLAKAFGNDYLAGLQHFLAYGLKEGRRSSPNFDVQTYKNNYKDLQQAFGNNWPEYFYHYCQYGYNEKRVATPVNTTSTAPTVAYCAHIQDIGDVAYVNIGNVIGTTGQSRRLEELTIKTNTGSIRAQAHVQNYGDMDIKEGSQVTIGTRGKELRMEAICISLNGVSGYSIKYRVHQSSVGWSQWYSQGQWAGVKGQSLAIEAIEIQLVKN